MASALTGLTWLQQRQGEAWLIGSDGDGLVRDYRQRLSQRTEQRLAELQAMPHPPRLLLVQRDPVEFLAGFAAAVSAGGPLFLGNPDWSQQEWQQVLALVQPDRIWGQIPFNLAQVPEAANAKPQASASGSNPLMPRQSTDQANEEAHWIMIPTGGSSGQIRFAIHTWATLMAAVNGFQRYFLASSPDQRINCFCVLPLHHVSGLMQGLRCLVSGGQFVVLPFKALRSTSAIYAQVAASLDPADFFLSLVPTQLQRLLQQPELIPWLARFHTILLGGAPAWPELLIQARHHQLRLAPTYGMTETAAQIATLKPDDFLRGQAGVGQTLPHARISICDSQGQFLGVDQIGRIRIEAASLALGYYPDLFQDQNSFQTDDLGFLDAAGNLHVVGRSSRKIITGGENVFPEEVEAAIRATHLVQDVCVLGLPDQEWGEVVTAVYVPRDTEVSLEMLKAKLQDRLSKFKQPKVWIAIAEFPRNAQGKINLLQLQQMIRPR